MVTYFIVATLLAFLYAFFVGVFHDRFDWNDSESMMGVLMVGLLSSIFWIIFYPLSIIVFTGFWICRAGYILGRKYFSPKVKLN